MCRVRCVIHPGLIETERVAIVKTAAGGTEEVTVSARSIEEDTIPAAFIGQDDGRVLVELPRETSSGRWRLWVPKEQVVG